VTKKAIIQAIVQQMENEGKKVPYVTVKEIVQRTLDAIVTSLADDERIELRNFGVFEVQERAARLARNPRTGDPVPVEARCVIAFKPGKEMRDAMTELSRKKLNTEEN